MTGTAQLQNLAKLHERVDHKPRHKIRIDKVCVIRFGM